MSSRRRNGDKTQRLRAPDGVNHNAKRPSALEENVQAIKTWEHTILLGRSKAEQISDWIACTAASDIARHRDVQTTGPGLCHCRRPHNRSTASHS